MRIVRKYIGLIGILLCLFIQQSLAGSGAATYTINREILDHAGLARLSDIFTLIDEWDMYSVDGYTFQGIASSSDVYHQQNWIILVDGHRLDIKLLDITNINLLPLSINLIDSIEVYDTAQLVEDVISESGLIHIHTRQAEEGFTLQGQFTAGNETGDPGPYRYTEFWSENVDRIAADESYWLSHRGDFGYMGAGYYSQTYFPTDPLIVDRNREIYPYANPVIKTYSYSARAGLPQFFSQPKFDGMYSLIEDFYFFKPLGREIPVKNYFLSVGLSGNKDFSNQLMLKYKFRYSRNSFKKRENAAHIDLKWALERFYATIYSRFKISRLTLNFGLGLEKTKAATDYQLVQNRVNDGIIYGSLNLNQESGSYLNLDTEIRFNNQESGIKISATNLWKVKSNQRILANVAYSQMMTNIENTLWYWSEKGYDFVRDQGGDYNIDGRLEPTRQWSGDLYWMQDQTYLPSIKAGILYRRFLRKNWEEQPFEYDFLTHTVSAPVSIKTGQTGHMGSLYLKLSYSHPSHFEHQLYYRYAGALGASGLFNHIRKQIPESLFIYRVTYKPVNNFSIWAMCKYLSPVFWHDFQNIDQQSNGLYTSHLSDIFLIDIAINKWLWNRQIKVDLILRNLLNKKNILYPIGSSPDLRIYAQAEMYFNFW